MGVALVALIICVDQLFAQSHVLLGIDEYDDGVYLGAALRLVHGVIPYRDFGFPHPPGVLLLLLPLSIVSQVTGTRVSTGAARVQTAFVAAGNVFLLARLVRHRGMPAVLVAGFFLAVFPLAVFADRTVMLEPYLVLFCLLGASALFAGDDLADRGRLVWAGLAFGFAGAIKVWAIFPAVVAVVCCAPRLRQHGGPLLLGIVTGFVVPSLPFVLVAPGNYVRDIVTVQLERTPSSGDISIGHRLVYMSGIRSLPSAGLATAIAVGFILVVAGAFLVRPRPTRLDWFALGTASLTVAAMLVAPDFFPHYAYFTAAFLALLLAVSCDRLVRAASRRSATGPDSADGRSGAFAPTVVVILVLLVALFGVVRSFTWHESVDDPGPAIAEVVPRGACVVSDEPALAITANRFVPDSAGCPAVVDSFFTWLVVDPTNPPPSAGPFDPGLVGAWRSWFSAADYVILSPNPFRIPWTPKLTSWFRNHFRQVSSDGATVYRRVRR